MKTLIALLVPAALFAQSGADQVGFRVTGGTVQTNVGAVLNAPFLYDTGFASAALACASTKTVAVTKSSLWQNLASMSCAAPLWFPAGAGFTGIKPASGQTITLTGPIVAGPYQVFDYSAGGAVVLTGAKIAEVYLEMWGTSTATLTTAACNAAMLSRQHISLVASTYTLDGPCVLRTGVFISGVNSNRAVVTLSGATAGFVTGADVTQVTVSGFKIDCNNSAQIGFRYAGQQSGGALDATELDMHDMEIKACTVAGYSGHHSYAVVLANNWFHGSAINIKLEDGYNNAYMIIGGTVSGATGASAVYFGNGTSVATYNSTVCQSNAGSCIEVNPTSGNSEMVFINPYFENNCLTIAGYDFKVDYSGYQSPLKGLKLITPHFFTGAGCTQAALFESVSDLSIDSPQWSGTSASKRIVVGRGVVRPVLNSGSVGYVNHAGTPISPTNGRTLPTNMLRCSVAMDTSVCTGPFAWAPSNGAVSDDGTLGQDGGMTWKLTYAGASSSAPGELAIPSNTLTWAGSLGGCGVWARTDAGTAYAWASVTGTSNYNGSDANAQRVIVGSSGWTWLWNSAGTDSADASPAGCSFKSYSISGASAMYFQYPQMWRDQAGTPPYVSTTTGVFDRVTNPIGHTVFARLGNAAIGQPVVCDNCTIANPTLTGGTGALAVPIGSAWVGK